MRDQRPVDTGYLKLRAQWLASIRRFFEDRGVLEVETPVLSRASVPDPNIESLRLQFAGQSYYLQTSPELYMKRLLAAGSGPIYQVARVFRDGEVGRLHNPEFTLVEWYRPGFDQHQLMDEVTGLIALLMELDNPLITLMTYSDLFEQYTSLNPLEENRESLDQYCRSVDAPCPVEDWDSAMDWLMAIYIQPQMQGLTYVTDYPATQASLARLDPDNPEVAKRFELFVDGVEIANGFEELTDSTEQRQRFMQENVTRAASGRPQIPMDEAFLEALDFGMPETSGVALGLDRLMVLATGSDEIGSVLPLSPFLDD